MGGKDQRKKALIESYKQKPLAGGVYKLENTENGRYILDYTVNLTGMKNRFEFSIKTNSCLHPKMGADWERYGARAFRLAVLEELEKKESQSEEEYKQDLKTLCELWREKLSDKNEY